MPEGPLLVLWKEQTKSFIGKTITGIETTTKMDAQRMNGKTITGIKTWGKHFLICFDDFTLRTHFLMFGDLFINKRKPPEKVVKLRMYFDDEELNFYACAMRLIDEPLDDVYDWSADLMNDQWNTKAALQKLKAIPQTLVCDALLDQTIFSGLGNIIKNEVLFRKKVHPQSETGRISAKLWNEIIKESILYCWQFYEWKKDNSLRKHWEAHRQKICPRDNIKFNKEYTGKLERQSFFCNECQVLYS